MCETLAELRDAMGRYLAPFDAAVLTAEQVHEALELTASLAGMVGTLEVLLGARLADVVQSGSGERSVAHCLARVAGTTPAEAARRIETGRRLEWLPALEDAARAGELSAQQLGAVADAATDDPAAAGRLVETARRSSLGELRDECARTKAAACSDLEERRRRIHARRSLRTWTDGEGVWHLQLRNNPEVGAAIMSVVEPIRDRIFSQARGEGRREPLEAYAADALTQTVCGGEGGRDTERAQAPPRPSGSKVIVRVDLPALLRGYPRGEEVCEIAGFGPVAVSAVRDLLDTADPFLAAVVTDGEKVVGVAHLGRRPNARQQTALQWLYPTCAVEGCSAVTFLETDHRVPWADSGMTVFDLLDRLCSHHHDLKTREGWALVDGPGKRPFVPPYDPRHPRHAHDPPAA